MEAYEGNVWRRRSPELAGLTAPEWLMKILQVHNFYQQKGGEDQVCAAEHKLLVDRGNQVLQYLVHNDAVREMSGAALAVRTIWNSKTSREVGRLIRENRPDVIHAHNTFPLISPALYYVAAEQQVPVVQTLHNYRLLCAAATLFRKGQLCEECVGRSIPYPAVVHSCYRGDRRATMVAASLVMIHRLAGTWTEKVQAFIALTDFSKSKFIQGGLPAERIVVKPNCLGMDPGRGEGEKGYALFAGRLTNEKGLRTLIAAWEQLSSSTSLKIAGEGPLSEWLKNRITALPNVEWLGQCVPGSVLELLKGAAFLIVPSEAYENLPMVIIEAFACGTPVIASSLGALQEIVQDGVNGLLFAPGDAQHLAAQIHALLSDPQRLRAMRDAARKSYQEKYSVERNYIFLMNLYNSVILAYKRASTV